MTVEDERPRPRIPSPADAESASRGLVDKAARENFPVAPFFLPAAVRQDLLAVYGYARLVDDIGDGDLPPGRADAAWLGLPGRVDDGSAEYRLALLDACEDDLCRVFDGRRPGHPILAALQPTVERHKLPLEPFRKLIDANRQDQRVRRYASYDELLGYCELSANPVGHLVLHIAAVATPERVRRSDAICTALQIVEHLQDVAEDFAQDRVYLPADDMRRFGVSEGDLAAPGAGRGDRVPALIAFEVKRAAGLLNEGAPLVGTVHGRLRLLLAGFVAGGRATLGAISDAGGNVLAGPPRAGKPRLLRELAATLLRER